MSLKDKLHRSIPLVAFTLGIIIGHSTLPEKPKEYFKFASYHGSKFPKVAECFTLASEIMYKDEGSLEDHFQTPSETQKIGTGDCEDYALYLASLLEKNDIKNYEIVFGGLNKASADVGSCHCWIEVEADGNTFVLDPMRHLICDRNDMFFDSYVKPFNDNLGYFTNKYKEVQARMHPPLNPKKPQSGN